MKYLIIVGIILAVVIVMPIATLWSLNILFPALAIPLTLETWCASLILGGVAGGGFLRSSK